MWKLGPAAAAAAALAAPDSETNPENFPPLLSVCFCVSIKIINLNQLSGREPTTFSGQPADYLKVRGEAERFIASSSTTTLATHTLTNADEGSYCFGRKLKTMLLREM